MERSRRRRALLAALALGVLLALLVALSLRHGPAQLDLSLVEAWRGALSALLPSAPLEPNLQAIVELRLWRTLTAAGVGAALGLSGALVQGVFRNGLASPSVLGISSGASLGAIGAVLIVGGYSPGLRLIAEQIGPATLLVPVCAFAGALAVAFTVYRLAGTAGHVSIPALLLIGIAINTFLGGVQQLVQMLVVGDWEVSRSILVWLMGTLDDRAPWHAGVVWAGLALALCVAPFVARELDLMQAGLEDAQSLGVDVPQIKFLTITAASLAAACAVAVAGQIAFVGLVVPHIVRLISGVSHRTLLPLSALSGAVFLLGADLAQRAWAPRLALQPGVLMSLIGGPFFVWLLWRKRREIRTW